MTTHTNRQIHFVTDMEAPELAIYGRIPEPQLYHYFEPEPGIFVAETHTVIERALDAGYAPISILADQARLDTEPSRALIARCPQVPVYTAPMEELIRITGYPFPRGVLCAMRRRPVPELSKIISGASRLVILERITNPTNIGAIFRSAAALGMDALLLSSDCADPLYRRAIRVSMGTVFQVPWTFLPEKCADKTIRFLNDAGFHTMAMALTDQSLSLADIRPGRDSKAAIVLGSEGDGLWPETISACRSTVRIPMMHGVDSLNVAAASAVVFWQLMQA